VTATQPAGAARSEGSVSGLRFEIPDAVLPFPAPEAGPDTAFFWAAGAEGTLLMTTCADCGYITYPPSPRCARCLSQNVAPQPVSGNGTVYSYTISLQPFMPGLAPYCVALVELDEQADVRLTTQLVDCVSDDIEVGMAVQVLFVAGPNETWIPFFRPASS
jgi:uncharacterized OB-fold protein